MENPLLNYAICLNLLRSSVELDEEYRRPWSECHISFHDQPLLRIWDRCSGSQPGRSNRLLSRAPRQPLRTRETRKESLNIHANHAKWEPTPFISFTTEKAALQDLADMRVEKKRGRQTLTVVNPNVRVANRMPILDMAAEMAYYGVQNPYGRSSYYRNHYLCLWEVTEEEVVGNWAWDDLKEITNWYDEIILQEFMKHDQEANYATQVEKDLDLSALRHALPRKFPDVKYWKNATNSISL